MSRIFICENIIDLLCQRSNLAAIEYNLLDFQSEF